MKMIYVISNFGPKNGNPFITVQGTAGDSFDPELRDEGSINKPHYSKDQILSKVIKLNECLMTA